MRDVLDGGGRRADRVYCEIMVRRCIYCLGEYPENAFNREHVVPRQLGSFENNLTLTDTVCIECNRYFGNSIELAFGRDSIEAVYRLRYGQKRPEEFQGFNGQRLAFRIPSNLPAGGVVLIPAADPEGKEVIMLLPPQVGIQLKGEADWHYYTEEDLASSGLPSPDREAKLRLLASDDAGLQRVRALVLARFPKFREDGQLDLPPPDLVDGKALVEIKSKVDRLLARAVAKISFNYMALHAGTHFALNASFDPIRRFIRFDEGPKDWRQFVQFLSKPLLAEETDELLVTRGHILILGWKDLGTLTVTFSPYNSMAYEVTLARGFQGIWQPLKVGHVFDWEHHEILRLTPNDRIVLPPGWANRAARVYQTLVQRPPL